MKNINNLGIIMFTVILPAMGLTMMTGCSSEPSAQNPASKPRTRIHEIKVSTAQNSTLINGFKSNAATYDIVDIPEDGRTNVIKISRRDCDWNFINFSLAEYRDKLITVHFSAAVMLVGSTGVLHWQLNNEPDYPSITNYVGGAVSGVWYHTSGKQILIPANSDPLAYLTTWGNDDPNTVCYIDNLSITIYPWDYTPDTILAAAGEAKSDGSRNIYVSAGRGTDSGDGTQTHPFIKIAHAMYYAKPGDTVMLDSGTYYESFRMPSGSQGKPVTLTAMTGAEVIITPTIPVTPQWKQHSGNIWVADVSQYTNGMETEFPQLFADKDSMVEARWPNMGPSMSTIHDYKRAVTAAGTNKNTVVARDDFPADIAGARVIIALGEDYISWETGFSFVKSTSSRTIKLSTDLTGNDPFHPGGDPYTPSPGAPFYITGALSLLDAPGEYYFDSRAKLLYFYPPWNGRPDARTLTLRSKNDIAIYAGNTSYVSIMNITVYGGAIFMEKAENNTIENCRINYAEHFYLNERSPNNNPPRMYVSGANNRIERCEFGPTAGSGIILEGEDIIFTNNIVHDATYAGGITPYSINVKPSKRIEISHNTIINSSHSHIRFEATMYGEDIFENCIIRNNYFENHATLNNDSGAFYAWGSDGGGTEIYNNFVLVGDKNDYGDFHRFRMGLYTDNYNSNFIIHHNIVIGGNNGLQMNLPSSGTIFYNNTVVGADTGIGIFGYDTDNADASTSRFTDNLFVNTKNDSVGYWAMENGKQAQYNGDFVNGTVPAPIRQEARVLSSGNANGTVDDQYRPTGNTPNIGAVQRNGALFPYGANWSLER